MNTPLYKMRCCFATLFFMCVVVFVQIRLRQQRDSLNFPLKFAVTYAVEGESISKLESTKLIVRKERLLYGTPVVSIINNTMKSSKGVDVSCYLNVNGEPMTFHTLSIRAEDKDVVSSTVILNNRGVGHVYLKHEFFYLNPSFSISHAFDSYMSGSSTGKSSASGFVEIRNLPVVLDKEIGLNWIQV